MTRAALRLAALRLAEIGFMGWQASRDVGAAIIKAIDDLDDKDDAIAMMRSEIAILRGLPDGGFVKQTEAEVQQRITSEAREAAARDKGVCAEAGCYLPYRHTGDHDYTIPR